MTWPGPGTPASAVLMGTAGLVLVVIGYHLWLGHHGRALRLGTRTRDHKFYRVMNELPVLVLFAIVGLVILKPF